MAGSDSLTAFLIGRLTQQGVPADAVLRVAQGRFPVPGSSQALAVGGGRLWLAHDQLVGGPSLADVPLTEVGEVQLRPGRRTRLLLRTGGGRLVFTVLDDDDAAGAFAAAAGGAGQAGSPTG